jgi:hypothetical protein
MAERISPNEIHGMLVKCLHNRPDLGVGKAMTTRILEPRNPFEPESIRRPQRWFVLFLLVSLALTGTFICFNFWD